jgi:CheY-like chemotaxis protein
LNCPFATRASASRQKSCRACSIAFTASKALAAAAMKDRALGWRPSSTRSGQVSTVDPEFLPYLFERFRQADSGFARAHGGLGLGLAICRHLVEAHGGQIEAISPGKGKGTTIHVELPLMIVQGEKDDDVARVHPKRDTAPSMDLKLVDLTGIRALLVDDDRDALAMARDALIAAGAQVDTAATAGKALRKLDASRFDAIVLDIGMPKVDGYELLHRIRQRLDDENSRVPAAALTAYAQTAESARSEIKN